MHVHVQVVGTYTHAWQTLGAGGLISPRSSRPSARSKSKSRNGKGKIERRRVEEVQDILVSLSREESHPKRIRGNRREMLQKRSKGKSRRATSRPVPKPLSSAPIIVSSEDDMPVSSS